jgi:hypothetical protein
MNPNDENDFWSKIGDKTRPRLSEAQWAAQRRRILARLEPDGYAILLRWGAAAAAVGLVAWFVVPKFRTQALSDERAELASWDVRISTFAGTVTVFPRGGDEGVPAAAGMPLDEGDEVRTGADGSAEFALSADGALSLGSDADVAFASLKTTAARLDLNLGALIAKLSWKGHPDRRLAVNTAAAVAAVRGTEFGVTVQGDGTTEVGVFDEGKVAVTANDDASITETLLQPHQETRVPVGVPIETETKDGRHFLRVDALTDFKPFQERMDALRERPAELRRNWKPLDAPQRERMREDISSANRDRLNALPPAERAFQQELLHRPAPNERRAPENGSGSPQQDPPPQAMTPPQGGNPPQGATPPQNGAPPQGGRTPPGGGPPPGGAPPQGGGPPSGGGQGRPPRR